jgi:uncharacterized protein YabN with tetrapyrrole methylase and pyrophosphatase domain
LTPEARVALEHADEVLFLLSGSGPAAWLQQLRPSARSLHPLYRVGRKRAEIYDDIAEAILEPVRRGLRVCAAFYGHPGVFVYPAHEAMRRARQEGFPAKMLPAVSAEDCLFAHLGIDPGLMGCQSYDATDFLLNSRVVDTTAVLILWQVSVVGEMRALASPVPNADGLQVLAEYLCDLYPAEHEVTLYECSAYPVSDPIIRTTPLAQLPEADLTPLATLVVPPASRPRPNAAMLARFGIASVPES